MAGLRVYRVRRVIATVSGTALLGLSGWYSWLHCHDVSAPLAVIVGAGMFHFAETSWQERFRLRAMLFGGLAVLAAFVSLTGALSRVGTVADTRLQERQTQNLPRIQAGDELAAAVEALATAEAAARAKCSSGRGPGCRVLEDREAAARQRVDAARTKLAGLGVRTVEDSLARRLAAILPVSETQVQLYLPLALPMWLELSGLVLVSFGLAPRRKARRPCRKRRATKKRMPRRSATRLGNVVVLPRRI
jgi:hypothetical protein